MADVAVQCTNEECREYGIAKTGPDPGDTVIQCGMCWQPCERVPVATPKGDLAAQGLSQ